MNMETASFSAIVGTVIAILTVVKTIADLRLKQRSDERLSEAEREAFQAVPESLIAKTKELSESQAQLEQNANQIAELLEESRNAVQAGSLFNLYSKQIEKYQTQTQSRAGWSFVFAIVSMASGLALVIWGGSQLIGESSASRMVAGSTIAVVGGALSGFITKTFLDVHRLSLMQLNHYFRQPVLNSHILTAQRLADQLPQGELRERAYGRIIENVSSLILSDPTQLSELKSLEGTSPPSTGKGPVRKKPSRVTTDASNSK